jgi:hypothetical protein
MELRVTVSYTKPDSLTDLNWKVQRLKKKRIRFMRNN